MNLILPRHGDLLEVTPTELDDDGLAIARIDWTSPGSTGVSTRPEETRRLRLIIRGALPGDRVRFRVESRTRDTIYGRMVELLAPAPHRRAPVCRHAHYAPDTRSCGGCTLQSLEVDGQLALKTARVKRAFEQHGVRLEVLPTRRAPKVFGHRHKMELSFASDPLAPVPNRLALGLHPPGLKWEVLTLEECPLLSPALSAFVPVLGQIFADAGLRAWDPRHEEGFLRNLVLREGHRSGDRLIELQTTALDPLPQGSAAVVVDSLKIKILEAAAQASLDLSSVLWTVLVSERGKPTRYVTTILHGRPTMAERLLLPGGRALDLEIDPRAFFQPHPEAAEGLIAEVVSRLGPTRTLLDLYCGTGTLGLALAPFVEDVLGIELVPEAVESANRNAARNGLAHAHFIAGDVGATLATLPRERLDKVDAVVLDPPRSGLHPDALKHLVALAPPRIFYISCKPESLARDLRLLEARGYRPEGPATPFDFFPHSHHVETLVSLTRNP
jgi:23S rRNA (uracil1939-C5)-methyltransferase